MDSPKQKTGEQEPTASDAPVPVGFLVALVVLFYLAILYLDGHAGGFHPKVYEPFASWDLVKASQPKENLDPRFERGRITYATYCSACHQKNGEGMPMTYPPLAGSDWVNAEGPNRVIRLVLNGLTGPIVVSGVEWNTTAQMVAWKDLIGDDEELASLITYIRGETEWGNHASPVSAEQVEMIRAELSSRSSNNPWTQAELFATPEF